MIWSDYWGALSLRQRISLVAAMALVAAATIGLTVWLLRDPYVPLASSLSSERLNELTQELDRAELDYHIAAGGEAVTVAQSQLGKARAAVAGGQFVVPPSVGLELFKETDFSSTDFAQKINYQRALQGELTRTIQTIEGVRSARVHVILADGGLFKRDAAKASAAVSVALHPGKQLTATQVRGIQRLVTASVPQIKIGDVVVLDESGTSLTRAGSEAEGELPSAQLDLKRQADEYFEGKLLRLLRGVVPQATASLSVDTILDERQLRVTTDEPIAVGAGRSTREIAAGVLVKERQSQRGGGSALMQASDYAANMDSTDWEYEYTVGHRVEQTLSAPGSIKRVSVAVALQGVPSEFSGAAVEQLIANAVGIDRSRGDSVTVLLLPGLQPQAASEPVIAETVEAAAPPVQHASTQKAASAQSNDDRRLTFSKPAAALTLLLAAVVAVFAAWPWLSRRRGAQGEPAHSSDEIDAMADKVRRWLNEGASGDRT